MANKILLYQTPGTSIGDFETGGSRLSGTPYSEYNIADGLQAVKDAKKTGVDTRLLMNSRVIDPTENSNYRSTSTFNFLGLENKEPVVITAVSAGALHDNPDRIKTAYGDESYSGLIRWCAPMNKEEMAQLTDAQAGYPVFRSIDAFREAQANGGLLLAPSYVVVRKLSDVLKSPFGYDVPLAQASTHPDVQLYAGSVESAKAFTESNARHHKKNTVGVHQAFNADDVKALKEAQKKEVAGF